MFSRRRSDPVEPVELNHLFVVTYGRSGSTLLMGLLNSIPGFLIRGENHQAPQHLFDYHRVLAAEAQRWNAHKRRQVTNPWFGISDFPAEVSLAQAREMITATLLRPEADTRVTGFKEIRWYFDEVEDYVAWLRQVFPGARFLLNTRNHEDVLKSEWWAKGDNAEHLAAIETRLLALGESLGEDAFHLHYDDYVGSPEALRPLFAWLGESYDDERIRAVLGTRHSL